MLDKTDKQDVVLRPVDGSAPAIFVRMSSQVGPNRTMEMSFGIPLDMTPRDLNSYLDKVAACAERQHLKGVLEQLNLDHERALKDLETNEFNLIHYQSKQAEDWTARGKHGDWKPAGSEQAQIKGFYATDKNLRENVIPRFRKMIEETEAKIAEGG